MVFVRGGVDAVKTGLKLNLIKKIGGKGGGEVNPINCELSSK